MEGYHTWLFHEESSHTSPNIEEVEVESSPADNELANFLRDITSGLDDVVCWKRTMRTIKTLGWMLMMIGRLI